ncbi:hypothetical protein SERLADRAFT_465024 [Serpula lacrymans var. lacrymans S7.9]|uniref:Uncharacterized protein n=1 Tax=Serpula lacrymans var. lacrymans (strain S7.9) TaxID=578457 RepID=F8NUJ0_SERL9|nr:uncharacterized protein SERLADRAFT_465024 [Serpula lacrymans var. lacrymans S7.9]EGO25210.1 hypothetical protein SERLADRAFT_465024 [Serpula lacrymans var. lacrymans S7.9]
MNFIYSDTGERGLLSQYHLPVYDYGHHGCTKHTIRPDFVLFHPPSVHWEKEARILRN